MNERNDDWMDRQLHEDARRPLDDAGFTSRVLAALPPAHVAPYPWLKTWLVVGSTALGGLLAALFAPIGPLVLEGVTQLVNFRGMTPSFTAMLAMTVVLAVSGYVLATED
jgi:hypothetical protein